MSGTPAPQPHGRGTVPILKPPRGSGDAPSTRLSEMHGSTAGSHLRARGGRMGASLCIVAVFLLSRTADTLNTRTLRASEVV